MDANRNQPHDTIIGLIRSFGASSFRPSLFAFIRACLPCLPAGRRQAGSFAVDLDYARIEEGHIWLDPQPARSIMPASGTENETA
jgi:hypothetical protein